MSHFTDVLDMSFFVITSFLAGVESADSVCSILKFCPVFLGSDEYQIVFFCLLSFENHDNTVIPLNLVGITFQILVYKFRG